MADSRGQERFRIPHADALFGDTWAEETVCPSCGRVLETGATHCPACWQWIGECGGACAGCPSPKCVGGRRLPETGERK